MQNDILVVRVRGVSVPAPAADLQIDLDVADFRGRVVELNDRVSKIRPRLFVPESGMDHAHALAVEGAQVVAPNALVKPNLLQQTFRRNIAASFAKICSRMRALAPFLIKMRIEQGHAPTIGNDALAKSRI